MDINKGKAWYKNQIKLLVNEIKTCTSLMSTSNIITIETADEIYKKLKLSGALVIIPDNMVYANSSYLFGNFSEQLHSRYVPSILSITDEVLYAQIFEHNKTASIKMDKEEIEELRRFIGLIRPVVRVLHENKDVEYIDDSLNIILEILDNLTTVTECITNMTFAKKTKNKKAMEIQETRLKNFVDNVTTKNTA